MKAPDEELQINKLGKCTQIMRPHFQTFVVQEKKFKLATLRLILRLCLGQNATTISPPAVSIAREAIEPSCQK